MRFFNSRNINQIMLSVTIGFLVFNLRIYLINGQENISSFKQNYESTFDPSTTSSIIDPTTELFSRETSSLEKYSTESMNQDLTPSLNGINSRF